MDKARELHEALKGVGRFGLQATIIAAEVISVDGESCKVKVKDLELSDVRLKATINGEANKILALPKVGSTVLIGSLTGDMRDLCVLRIDEVERLQYEQEGLKIEVDSITKKVSIENDSVSLKSLFDDLADIIKTLKLFTANGPTNGLLPDSLLKVTEFESNYNLLLK
ncbi:hypothetical protein ABDK00_016875 [Niabella insulamsoli]|uniref:hypothetical protein n=1 Tax=Niabella insulamsoli TaxID=3144874 RepID=UPI0031FC5E74